MFRKFHTAALAAAAALALAAGLAATPDTATAAATATRSCASTPYAYAGLMSTQIATGVRASITATRPAQVANGHVAGWIGVGGPGRGANGQDAWIQIGINTVAGQPSVIYAEAWIPGHGQAYKELGQIAPGDSIDVAVRELAGKPGTWRAFLNGKAVTKPVYLPGSHRAWEPMAISENWNGGGGSCNSFTYKFGNVQIGNGATWQAMRNASTLTDPGYKISNRTTASFLAGSAV